MKTFAIRSILGIFFGSFLTLVVLFFVIYAGNNETLNSSILVKNAVGTVFCGWFFTVTPLFFENEKLTLPVQTIFHFICVSVLYFIVAFVIGWVPFTAIGFLSILSLFIVIYAIIWTAFYLYFKKQATALNEELKEL
ncbi:DUF3021 domain-containing protein [Sporosarcina sp. SAFN-015]|uniref:DUF3021 domain-containing protein n=1 Tax=Sporosarcina sp. SAFN-015 TaxID=3387274 RepID=UPI003F7F7DA1